MSGYHYEIRLGDGSYLQFSTIHELPPDVLALLFQKGVYRAQIMPRSFMQHD